MSPGEYAGFEENEPTSRSGGKGVVIKKLKELNGFKRIVMIGDGATDLEASPPADAFIGEDPSFTSSAKDVPNFSFLYNNNIPQIKTAYKISKSGQSFGMDYKLFNDELLKELCD